MAVGVLTAAPWHLSIGDIATADVTLDRLATSGIPARHVSAPEDECDFLIIGGGEVLQPVSEGRSRLWEQFQVPGAHILNACGIADGLHDFGFLADYRLVAVRDRDAAARVRPNRPDVSCVPCPATLVQPLDWDFVRTLPDYAHLNSLQPHEYVVVHRHPALAPLSRTIDMPVLAIDAQAFKRYRWTGRGLSLPTTHSSRVVQTFVSNAAVVVTNSLHLAIFAIGAAVPFVAVDLGDHQSNKIRRYLERAQLDESMTFLPAQNRTMRNLTSRSTRVARRMGFPDVLEQAQQRARPGGVGLAHRAASSRRTISIDLFLLALSSTPPRFQRCLRRYRPSLHSTSRVEAEPTRDVPCIRLQYLGHRLGRTTAHTILTSPVEVLLQEGPAVDIQPDAADPFEIDFLRKRRRTARRPCRSRAIIVRVHFSHLPQFTRPSVGGCEHTLSPSSRSSDSAIRPSFWILRASQPSWTNSRDSVDQSGSRRGCVPQGNRSLYECVDGMMTFRKIERCR